MRTELVLQDLDMAIDQRHARGGIPRSRPRSPYPAVAYGQRCPKAGLRPSMRSIGDGYDNALCESFFTARECELLVRWTF